MRNKKIMLMASVFMHTLSGLYHTGMERPVSELKTRRLQKDDVVVDVAHQANQHRATCCDHYCGQCCDGCCGLFPQPCGRLFCPYPDDHPTDRYKRFFCWFGISVLAGTGIAVTTFLLKQ